MFLDWSLDGCFLQSLSTDYEHIVCKWTAINFCYFFMVDKSNGDINPSLTII